MLLDTDCHEGDLVHRRRPPGFSSCGCTLSLARPLPDARRFLLSSIFIIRSGHQKNLSVPEMQVHVAVGLNGGDIGIWASEEEDGAKRYSEHRWSPS